MKKLIAATIALMLTASVAQAQPSYDPENTLLMDLEGGRVIIELRPDIAPKHTARYKELARQGYFDGVTFHRVIDGFMAQAGDPTGTGSGGTGQLIPAEFSKEPFVRGVLGAARKPHDVNSADSQFFIMFGTNSSLNGDYTVFGRVVEGMELVDKLNRCEPQMNQPHCALPGTQPSKIVKVTVAADEGKAKTEDKSTMPTPAPESRQ